MSLSELNLRPFDERRKILEQNMKEIPGRIMLSEQTFVTVSFIQRMAIFKIMSTNKYSLRTRKTCENS
jgi:hypothetical protein